MNERAGVYWYAGAPTAGKSTKALEDLALDVRATGNPCLVIDSQGVWNFRALPHAGSVREVIEEAWGKKRHIAFTPTSIDQVDQISAAARAGLDVHILIDEARYWMSSHMVTRELSLLARTWQHSRLTIRLTTQRLEDIHQDWIACTTELYVFRCTSPRTLDRLEAEFGMKREEIAALPRGSFLTWRAGF